MAEGRIKRLLNWGIRLVKMVLIIPMQQLLKFTIQRTELISLQKRGKINEFRKIFR